jgi:hypothetical protein
VLRFLAGLAVASGVVLTAAFIGWIVARVNDAPAVVEVCGRIILWDIWVMLALGAYVAFVGAWHLWERITGKMELQSEREARERAEAEKGS